jgi:hypothetical protein
MRLGALLSVNLQVELFISMLLCVSLRCVFSVLRSMNGMAPCCVGVVRRLFVAPRLVVRRRFTVVSGGVRVVSGCLSVMFRCLLGHAIPPKDP